MPACENSECGVSTGICGKPTFGSGELDNNGYWEWPCLLCADAYVTRHGLDVDDVWPQPFVVKDDEDDEEFVLSSRGSSNPFIIDVALKGLETFQIFMVPLAAVVVMALFVGLILFIKS